MANKQWIDDALEAINEMREFHQADALEWSDECYQEALKQAEACSKSSKLAGGNNSGKSGPHGQILYAGEGGGKADIPGATQEWYEASSKYDFFKAVGGKESEDFTQLVWKDTKHVGMAISACGKFIVANFLPAGNVKGAFAKNVLLPEFEADKEVEDLGMIFNSFPPMPLIVKEVAEDSWADSVDISEGDRFYSINDKKVEGMPTDEYKELIQKRPLRLKLLMGTSLAEEPKEEEKKKEKAAKTARRGSVGRGKSELIAEKGVDKIGMILSLPPKALEVRKVTPGGWADTKGIEPGDIFMEVNGKPVAELTPEQFKEAMMNRPIKFKLATLEEQKAAVILQRVARKSLAARLAGVSEWRGDIFRKAKQDSEDDKDELAASGRTREELIKAVFDACKPNKDGNLQQKELLRFARHIDFPGTDEDWEIEYGELCKEYKWDKAEGIDFEDFQDLVDEEKGNPYYCGNDRLDGVLIRIDQIEAATKIQASFKGRSVRKKQAERFNRKKGTDEEEKAATKIQSVRLGKKAREEVKKKKAEKDGKTGDKNDNKKDDAKDGGKKVDPKEQKKFKEKDYSKEEEKAAVKIQSVQRGKKAREEVQKKKDEKDGKNAGKKDNKKDDAKDGAKKIDPKEKDDKKAGKKDNKKDDAKDGAKKIDPKEQKKLQEKDYSKEEEKAAVKIQSIQRGKKAREEVQKKKDEKDGKNGDKAPAAKAGAKKAVAKKAVDKKDDKKTAGKKDGDKKDVDKKDDKKTAGKKDGDKKDDKSDQDKKEEKAATKIQSIQRGKKARAEVEKMKEAKDAKKGDTKDDKKESASKDKKEAAKKGDTKDAKKGDTKDAKKGDTKDDKKSDSKDKKEGSKKAKEETKKSKEEEEEEKAATKIQSIQRGKKTREEVNKKKDEKGGKKAKDETDKTKDEKAAKKGDKEEKGKKRPEGEDEKKKKEEEEKAATKIQSIQRGKKARAEVEKKKKEAKEEGGNKAKETKKSKEEKAGAEKPQKGDKDAKKGDTKDDKKESAKEGAKKSDSKDKKEEQKGKKAEEEEDKKKKNEKEQSEEEKAATKIQSMHRGKKAREEVKKKKEDKEKGKEKSETAKQPSKDEKGKQPSQEKGKEKSETAKQPSKDEKGKQKSQTPKELTKEEKEQEEAAKKIQSVHRGKKAREEVQKMKEDQAGGKKPATMGKIKSGATFSSAAAQRDQERMEREASRKERQARKEKPPNAKAKPKNQTKEEAEQEAAAISIQNKVRQRQAKKKVDEKRMEKAREEGKRLGQAKFASETPAPKIAPKAPKKPLNQEDAAAKIQARQRGKIQRKDLERRKQEFSKLDRDNDGYLNELEMKNFACLLGYSGSDREWRQEYDALCYQFRWDSRVGLSERDFIWLTTNPKEQYWFDAKRLDQGWEVAAEMPEDADLVETLLPSQLGPGGQQIPSGAVMREQLRSSVEVPIVAEVAGLDWEKLISNDDLKDKLQQNISRILNKKTGISMSDLKVTLSSASRAMPGRA